MADVSLSEVAADPDKLDQILIGQLLARVKAGDAKAAAEASKIGERIAARKAMSDATKRLRSLEDPVAICREVGRLGEGPETAAMLLGRALKRPEKDAIAVGAKERIMEVRAAELTGALAGGAVQRWMTTD